MEQGPLLHDLIVILGAAWAAGLLARRLRLPLLVGYIAAGIIVGPHALGLIYEPHQLQTIALLGVALLLFALGAELSLQEVLHVRRVALWGGGTQIALTVLLGYGLGAALGWGPVEAILLGFALALGSTAVLVKVLSERGEVHTQHARVVIGVNIMQDLAAVVMVGLLPALETLSGGGASSLSVALELGALLGKGAGLLVLLFLLARVLIPRLFLRVARTGSRELFLITVVFLCLSGAGAAQALGLSLALGAFLAGLMVSESEFHHQTFASVVSLRDLFGLLFFSSLGLLFDPEVLLRHPGQVALLVSALVFVKTSLVMILVLWAGYHLRTAIMSGLALGQIGEFSFVIIQIALSRELLSPDRYGVIIAAAVISMALTPLLLHLGRPLYQLASALPWLRRFTRAVAEEPELARARAQSNHVLLCGYGRVGRIVGEALRHFGAPLVVIDYDQDNVMQLRREGLLALYGDAASPVLLEESGAEDARVAVLALPELRDTLLALNHLNQMNAEMPKIARGIGVVDLELCYIYGAEEMVYPEVECGLELARHALLRLGFSTAEVQEYVDTARVTRYRCGPPPEEGGWSS